MRSPTAPADLRRLARLSAVVAAGDQARAVAAARALVGRVPRRAAVETILQTYLFAGFPAAINGFVALERAWPDASSNGSSARRSRSRAVTSPPRWRTWQSRGRALCERVYGSRYTRLRARMRALSPELDEWMVVEGYGKTLSRPGLSAVAREICAVAALAATGAAVQLDAHLRGALRLGADPALLARVARDALAQHPRASRRAELERLIGAAVPRRADERREAATTRKGSRRGRHHARPPSSR